LLPTPTSFAFPFLPFFSSPFSVIIYFSFFVISLFKDQRFPRSLCFFLILLSLYVCFEL
jgi:hypothetical protein